MINRGTPIGKSPALAHTPARPVRVIRLSVQQLLDIPDSSFKLGSLTLKDWNTRLISFFHATREASKAEFGSRFFNLMQIYASKKAYKGPLEDQLRGTLVQTFIARFCVSAENFLNGDKEESFFLAVVFLELKQLSLDLHFSPTTGRSAPDLVKAANEHLSSYAESCKQPYQMIVVS
ncbi:MAG: hypothetical protein PHG97_07250 [Candidatus Margulisbacteria bacterium]|nr:hypothetical protein [Candidatus Margulisiibacteriota bacterium]